MGGGSPTAIKKALPLTAEGFAPYGSVIGLPASHKPADADVKDVNQGTAKKIVGQAPVLSTYASLASTTAATSIHLYHCTPLPTPFSVKVLERHRFTTQAFIPMTPAGGKQQGALIIVAQNGADDKPDLRTLAAFHSSTTQGISYHPGIWHHPMVALGSEATDFACVVNESEASPELNCDEVFYDQAVATYTV